MVGKKKNPEIFWAKIFVLVFIVLAFSYLLPKQTEKEQKITNKSYNLAREDFGNGTEELVISGDTKIEKNIYKLKSLLLKKDSVLRGIKGGVIIKAQDKIVIEEGALMDFSGLADGYYSSSVSEGTHAGKGGAPGCDALSTISYGDDLSYSFGSAGYRPEGGKPGFGGEYIELIAPRIILKGTIDASGKDGTLGGGGAGGKVVLITKELDFKGVINIGGGNGSSGNTKGYGGGGGGWVFLPEGRYSGKVVLSGGKGGYALDIYTGCNGEKGKDGRQTYINFAEK